MEVFEFKGGTLVNSFEMVKIFFYPVALRKA